MSLAKTPQALTIMQFWRWAAAHYNCIVRAGCTTSVVYDQTYLHWHLIEEDSFLIAQVVKGKDLIAEVVIEPAQVMYIEATPQEDENVLFELIGTVQGESMVLFHFLMSHGYDEEQDREGHKWTH